MCVGWSTNRDNEIAKTKKKTNIFGAGLAISYQKNSKWNNICLAFFLPRWYFRPHTQADTGTRTQDTQKPRYTNRCTHVHTEAKLHGHPDAPTRIHTQADTPVKTHTQAEAQQSTHPLHKHFLQHQRWTSRPRSHQGRNLDRTNTSATAFGTTSMGKAQ